MNGGTFGRSHSEVPSCSTRCQEVGRGWTGWHTNEFPQESDPASRATVSLSGRSRGGRRPLAVPSVNIKTPSSSPSPLLMRVVGADLHDNKRGSPRKDEDLTCSLIHWLVHQPTQKPRATIHDFSILRSAKINRRWMGSTPRLQRGWRYDSGSLKRKFLVSVSRDLSPFRR